MKKAYLVFEANNDYGDCDDLHYGKVFSSFEKALEELKKEYKKQESSYGKYEGIINRDEVKLNKIDKDSNEVWNKGEDKYRIVEMEVE